MQISKQRPLLGAMAALVAGGAVAALINATSAHARPATAPRTLHFVERGGGLKLVDNPPKAKHPYDFSAGDIAIVTRTLYDRSGAKAGSLRLACLATSPTTQHCNGTEQLAGGTLELAGTSSPAPNTPAAVIGGTGTYNGARGTSLSVDRKANHNIADQTITLLP